MRSLSERIYDFNERSWSANTADFNPPPIRRASYVDSTETVSDVVTLPSRIPTFGTIDWAPQRERFPPIREEGSSPPRTPRPLLQPDYTAPTAGVTRRSSICGTTNWAPHTIHYRITTSSHQGSLSGATVRASLVEVLEGDEGEEAVIL
jgi:hypothetical protein